MAEGYELLCCFVPKNHNLQATQLKVDCCCSFYPLPILPSAATTNLLRNPGEDGCCEEVVPESASLGEVSKL